MSVCLSVSVDLQLINKKFCHLSFLPRHRCATLPIALIIFSSPECLMNFLLLLCYISHFPTHFLITKKSREPLFFLLYEKNSYIIIFPIRVPFLYFSTFMYIFFFSAGITPTQIIESHPTFIFHFLLSDVEERQINYRQTQKIPQMVKPETKVARVGRAEGNKKEKEKKRNM